MDFDVTVIGGGPGGYVAAIRASQLGHKVALVERDSLGGVCLNWGCIPTKTLLKTAQLYREIREKSKAFGLVVPEVSIDYPKVIGNSRKVAGQLSRGVSFLMKKNNIQVFPGFGHLKGDHKIEIQPDQGPSQTIESRFILLATGGRPRYLPHLQPDGEGIWGSRDCLSKTELPPSLVIVGAGAIGVEFAYFFNSLGSKVTLIEMMDRMVPQEDEEISGALQKSFEKQGIRVVLQSKIEDVKKKDDSSLEITFSQQGETKTLEAHTVLLAMGVQANVENMGLEEAGVQLQDHHIQVNPSYQTSQDHIYAIGDVIGPPWLAHVASREAILAVEHLSGREVEPLNYNTVPGCTYCQPQIASVGYTEKSAREAGYEISVGRFPLSASGKARAMGEKEGFVKIIVDTKYGEILGCHILGSEATELISEITLARVGEMTFQQILQTIHPHPTLSEAILEATHDALGEGIHI